MKFKTHYNIREKELMLKEALTKEDSIILANILDDFPFLILNKVSKIIKTMSKGKE